MQNANNFEGFDPEEDEDYDSCGPEDQGDYGDDDYEDYDSGLSYSQQVWQDRNDYANDLLRAGKIDPEQANEIRYGA